VSIGDVRRRRPTIVDVAARAGVSKSLVSRALRGATTVSAERRAAVWQAVEELGYRPNAVARSLVQRRSQTVGVLVADLHNLFFAGILDGIEAAAAPRGYRVLIITGHRRRAAEAPALETLLELRVDGIILAGALLSNRVVTEARAAVPVALVARDVRVPGVDTVANDDLAGAALAVEHLHGLGHRQIALVDGGRGPGAADRRRGYEAAMHRLGLGVHVRVATGDFTDEGGYQAARSLLAQGPAPTAICAANDLAATGVLTALLEAGLRVPADVSLVGYDDTALAALRHLSLTTVHQPRAAIGQAAMEAVLARIDGGDGRARRVLLAPSLVERATTGPPAR
jgi:DNA-binding LacI/PurR family transcriptional regulator